MERPDWTHIFVAELYKLGVRGVPHFIDDMAEEVFSTRGHLDPFDVAQTEWAEWPPDDDS